MRQPVLDQRRASRIERNQPVVLEPAEELNQQEGIALDPRRLLQELLVRLGSEHVGRDLHDRLAVKRPQPNELRPGFDELHLRQLHLWGPWSGRNAMTHATGSDERR